MQTNMGENEASTSYERKSNYFEPVPSVKSMNDMELWMKSTAYYDIIGFISMINQAIRGKKLSTKLNPSPIANDLLQIFDALNIMIDKRPQTFGDWFNDMENASTDLLEKALPPIFHRALIEVRTYFIESFGNATQNEYGFSHELAFIMFLCTLFKIHALDEMDNLFVGLKLFNAYVKVVHRLQLIYQIQPAEYQIQPAGDHDALSMDSYQYIPFIWGSAQLSVEEPFGPNRFLETEVINRYKNEYYFIKCVDRQVKGGSSTEYSNQLVSLGRLNKWVKINSILIEIYEQEVLAEFSVIQHVRFGKILKLKEAPAGVISELSINRNLAKHQQVILDHLNTSTTIWEVISSQLVWLISLLCSGWFSNHAALILWCVWIGWLVWLIVRICIWASKSFNQPTPPPTP